MSEYTVHQQEILDSRPKDSLLHSAISDAHMDGLCKKHGGEIVCSCDLANIGVNCQNADILTCHMGYTHETEDGCKIRPVTLDIHINNTIIETKMGCSSVTIKEVSTLAKSMTNLLGVQSKVITSLGSVISVNLPKSIAPRVNVDITPLRQSITTIEPGKSPPG